MLSAEYRSYSSKLTSEQCSTKHYSSVAVGLFWLLLYHYKITTLNHHATFTARRYASAVFAVVVRPSVCPSVRPLQAGIESKRLDESSWFLAWRLFSIYPTLFYKEIEYLKQKLEYFLLEFCPKLQTEKILPRPVDRVVNKIRRRRRRSRLLTTSIRQSRRLVAVYNKSVNCNPSTPLLRFVLDYIDLLYNFFLQLTRF